MLSRLDISLIGPVRDQALTPSIDAGNSIQVTVRPLDANLAAAVPISARYRVDDALSGQNSTPWTALTPSAAMAFVLSGNAITIRNVGHDFERRQIMVEATDADGTIRRTQDYLVSNTLGTA